MPAAPLDSHLLHIQKTVDIKAALTTSFAALLEQLGPGNETLHGPMPMKLEAWPGGRWYRDLGNHTGHLWGHVQVIKPPTLLEIHGPLFMSYAVVSHVQYRLFEHDGGTRLTLLHRAFGDIAPEHREGAVVGWEHIIAKVKERAQGKS